MSDPLWFLENFEENESKSEPSEFTLNYTPQESSVAGQKEWNPETINSQAKDTSAQGARSQESPNEREDKTNKVFELDLLKDEESLRDALQNSLLNSIKNVQNPEIQITVNSNSESTPLSQNKVINSFVDSNPQNEKSKIVIVLNKKENGQAVGEEKKFVINNSNDQNSKVDDDAGPNQQPKVYVILPPDQNQSKVDSALTGDTNTRVCEEMGSTVINLNDLISSKGNAVYKNGEITANVDLSSIVDPSEQMPKVKLVIKIGDERKIANQARDSEETSANTYSENEIARLKELLKNSATLDSLESQVQSVKQGRNIPIKVSSATSQTSSYKGVSDSVNPKTSSDPSADWENKSTDSYIRRDGAQCTRTVWTTPHGRRVETKCFKDDRTSPRSRRGMDWYDMNWSPSFGSFWNDIDNDIYRLFSHANRFF